MAKDITTAYARNEAELQPDVNAARVVAQTVWQGHKQEIKRLKFTQKLSLAQIKELMERTHGFQATDTQWKKQLAKWGFRRNMNLTDAAYLVWLQRDADRRRIQRRLKFNNEFKSRKSLEIYIKKSKKVGNEEELLAMVSIGDTLPAHITYEDEGPSPPRTPLRPCTDNGSFYAADIPDTEASTWLNVPMATATQNHSKLTTPGSSLSQRTSMSSFDHMDFTSSSLGFLPDVSQEEIQEESDLPDSEDEDEPTVPNTKEVLKRIAFVGQSPCLDATTEGLLCPSPDIKSHGAKIFGLLSSTPLSMQYQPPLPAANTTIEPDMASVSHMNPPANDAGISRTPSSQCPANTFLARCFFACMCFGQSYEEGMNDLEESANLRVDEAMLLLGDMILDRDGQTLSTLSILLAMLEALGQLGLAQKLLRRAFQVSKQKAGTDHALTITLDWMVAVPDRSSHFKELSPEGFETLRDRIAEDFGSKSESALVASYNVGWALLRESSSDEAADALRLEKAADVLGSLRNQCEEILGLYHLQTIMTSVTLARVYFHRGKVETAEALIEEMIRRLKKVFPPFHPYLLEALRRQAIFLQKLGKHHDAEEILRKVVEERFSILGPTNPRSTSTLKELHSLMIKRGEQIAILDLHRQIKARCVEYEFDRKREACQWGYE